MNRERIPYSADYSKVRNLNDPRVLAGILKVDKNGDIIFPPQRLNMLREYSPWRLVRPGASMKDIKIEIDPDLPPGTAVMHTPLSELQIRVINLEATLRHILSLERQEFSNITANISLLERIFDSVREALKR